MQMLAKSPDARPQSAAELQHRLDALQAAPRRARMDPRAATARTRPGEPTASTRVLGAGRRARRPRAAAAAALAAGIIAIVAILALAFGAGSSAPTGSARRAASLKAKLAPEKASASTRAATAPKPAPSTPSRVTTRSAKTPQMTVAAAAGAVSSLLAQAAQSGALDQKGARQMTAGLEDVLRSYEAGRPLDAQRAVLDLSGRLTALQEQGRVSPTAAAPLATAVAGLGSTLANSATPPSAAQGAQPETPPTAPGQDGEAPGKGAKHGDGHKHGAGD
jgi:hypothetical protein